jgi:hypothetical protein
MNKRILIALSFILWLGSPVEASQLYRGIYVWGAEVETFSLCGSAKSWWIQTDEQLLKSLREAHNKFTSSPYEGIYAELFGEFSGFSAEDDGFALQYEGIFNVESARSISQKSEHSC